MAHPNSRSRPHEPNLLPKGALYAAAALIACSLTIAAIGSFTGYRVMRVETPPIVAERVLSFIELEDGVVQVRDPNAGVEVAVLPETESGFVRNVLRGFSYRRRLEGRDAAEPYRIMRFDDHRMAMIDLTTGVRYSLHAHGQRNIAAFAALVPMPGTATN